MNRSIVIEDNICGNTSIYHFEFHHKPLVFHKYKSSCIKAALPIIGNQQIGIL